MEAAGIGRRIAGGLLLLALTGCNAHATAPAPDLNQIAAPQPSFSCTPETGGAPTPCTPEEYSYQEKVKVVYAEAKDVYERFAEEYTTLLREGGAEDASEVLLETTGGPYLDAQRKILRDMHDQGIRATGGSIELVRLEKSPGASAYGYEVALDACIDSRSVSVVKKKKEIGQGYAYTERVFFKRVKGTLKIWDAEGKKVQSC
jgi:hypothetical protein